MKIKIVCAVFFMNFGVTLSPAFSESLFNEETFVPLIADYRAITIGDSVTIVIVESSLARASDGDNNSGSLNANASGRLVTTNREEVGSGALSLGYDADRDSATNRDGLFKAVVTADVVDIDLHGRLLLHGKQHLIVNGEDQYIAISGWVRPIHIDGDNTVVSSRISQAKIVYSGKDPDRISIWSRLKSIFCCGWFSEDEPISEADAGLHSQADYSEELQELDK
ncbi:flagellar basal body L-ring protein FlgH [Microbulbifer rhizosphaerae]|uniref:Flagellar L-ring protein FlgH n=1 Tax=Microbulbifer rhizosphaerae TaxID=1562603 RepID=A0A7W4WH41_9GAMM|nr:flagellar basal body L-ring protein FlgH [Microbulbifer rhizosphaerae]MBB3063486.1 flagellar L-ring protein precursor FlgH [Microbulbifer rhizosphaerae]